MLRELAGRAEQGCLVKRKEEKRREEKSIRERDVE